MKQLGGELSRGDNETTGEVMFAEHTLGVDIASKYQASMQTVNDVAAASGK